MRLIIEAEKEAVICGCPLLILSYCLKSTPSPPPHARLLNCVATGTREPMDGVLRAPGECGKKKLFPIDPLCPQPAQDLDGFGCGVGGVGQGQTSSHFHVQERCGTQKHSGLIMMAARG